MDNMDRVKSVPPATDKKGPECPYYPCHKLKDMLCVYCYCPLYYDVECGGNYVILPNGIKDCSDCVRPHTPEGIKQIQEQLHME